MKRAVLALSLVACKADLHQTVDAQPLDTAIDSLSSETGEAPPNAVKLTVTRVGAPVADVAVFFQAADSSLIAQKLTNASGVAWAIMPNGGFVTAREHKGQQVEELSTFAGVQPADSLELTFSPTGDTTQAMVHVQVPALSNAVAYNVYSPCGEAPMAMATDDIRLVGCGAVTDLVIVPADVDGNPLGSLFAPNVSVDGPVDLTSSPYQPLRSVQLRYTNVPDFVSFIGMYESLSATRRAFAVTAGEAPVAHAATATVSMPTTSATELTATNLYPTSGEIGIQTIYNWHAATTTYDLDLDTVLLPPFATAPVFAQPTHTLSWTERPGDIQPDVVRARIHVYRDAIPTGTAWTWRIVAARSGTSVTYPQLPIVDNFDFTPAAGDTVAVEELQTISLPGGFAGFRTRGFAEARDAIAGTLGRIVQQDLYFESL
ncbi:MAG TPA: hypothetical protein VMZ53_33540 [Kofleriaceae bacterium]|nr:hypothetical protein [Kofleriaceae bacterium]